LKYLDEYRDGDVARKLLDQIRREVTRPWVLMEICGGQTHAILRSGLDQLLPAEVELVHGPGCPVCVTPVSKLDRAHTIAREPDVIFCSFGDMLRVPGSETDLLTLKAQGADVRVVYSPLDALTIARAEPTKRIVFFAIGFETTAPANALAVEQACRQGLNNFSVLVSQVLVPPAIEAILAEPGNRVQGFLGPGHVCAVSGYEAYEGLAKRFGVPIVITGFEPVDLLHGIRAAVHQLEQGKAEVENGYGRVVRREGNRPARELVERVFEVDDQEWRGVGRIPASGCRLREEFARFDAEKLFALQTGKPAPESGCMSGEILRGVKKPIDCPEFGTRCTPDHPLGATMVSGEGACAAYHASGRRGAG